VRFDDCPDDLVIAKLRETLLRVVDRREDVAGKIRALQSNLDQAIRVLGKEGLGAVQDDVREGVRAALHGAVALHALLLRDGALRARRERSALRQARLARLELEERQDPLRARVPRQRFEAGLEHRHLGAQSFERVEAHFHIAACVAADFRARS
jgi:hypothetical protein